MVWKIHEADPEASYEASLVKQHETLLRKGDKLWLTGRENEDLQEYLIFGRGKIIAYRFLSITKNRAGVILKRDFNYRLAPVLRTEIKRFSLSYPENIPFLDADKKK